MQIYASQVLFVTAKSTHKQNSVPNIVKYENVTSKRTIDNIAVSDDSASE